MIEAPKTMTAAVLIETGAPLQIIEGIRVPDLRRGQVLVKVAYSGVCHSQVMEARGHRGEDKWLPHMLGHEGTGTVVAIGEGVTKVIPGDVVVLGWIKGDGIEAGGCQYLGPDGQTINAGGVTTFSDYTVASENRLVKLPQGTPLELGVLYGCALPTGAGIVLNAIQPQEGATIAVVGLGGIGLSALMAAKSYNPSKLIAVDVEQKKLDLALELGADVVINAQEKDAIAEVKELTGGQGVDYAIEAAGSTRTIESAFEMTRRGGGRCVFASHPPQAQTISIDPYELICGKKIEGSWGGGSHPDRDVATLGSLYAEGKLPLEKLISAPYALEQINQALDDLENRTVTRALIKIGV
jgi:S-(hydroxymethyl)glutathione dehydrogenase/alcohol dehydrogenase